MDGFHYTRAQLDAMQDPAYAHARRGAPFTFDADTFVACVRQVCHAGVGFLWVYVECLVSMVTITHHITYHTNTRSPTPC